MSIELRIPTSNCELCGKPQYEYEEHGYTQHTTLCERYRTLERIVAVLVLTMGADSDVSRKQVKRMQKGEQPKKISLNSDGVHIETVDDD